MILMGWSILGIVAVMKALYAIVGSFEDGNGNSDKW
jgi:hypothetical protein